MLGGGIAVAQTNAPATNAPAHSAAMDIDITSDQGEFDQTTRQMFYRGHVVVTDPQVRLTCAQLTVTLPTQKARHLERVLAETNVVMDYVDDQGEKYHITAAQGTYDYAVVNSVTNETVTFAGSPKVVWGGTNSSGEPMNWMTGEPIYYVRVNGQKGRFRGINPQIHSEQSATGTNSEAAPLKLF